jgi:hypothetical protein
MIGWCAHIIFSAEGGGFVIAIKPVRVARAVRQ